LLGKKGNVLVEAIAHLSTKLFYLLLHQGPHGLRGEFRFRFLERLSPSMLHEKKRPTRMAMIMPKMKYIPSICQSSNNASYKEMQEISRPLRFLNFFRRLLVTLNSGCKGTWVPGVGYLPGAVQRRILCLLNGSLRLLTLRIDDGIYHDGP